MTAPHSGIDTVADLTPHLPMLVREQVKYASQYLRSGALTKARADAIRAAGINLILNFEGRGADINAFSAQTGARDAAYALNAAKAIGAPQGVAIYFSCEPTTRSLTSDYANRVLPYWRAARQALGGYYRIGAYTFGTWLDWMLRDQATDFCWLPNADKWPGYPEFLASGRWHYHQIPGGGNRNFNGLSLDWDEPNTAFADIGAWMAGAPSIAPPAPVAVATGTDGDDANDPTAIDLSSRPMLRRGASGPAVSNLQKILGLTADGQFGPATEAAVKVFQTDQGLKDDGIVGPDTWNALAAHVQGV